jgi:hypothetical protein
MYMERVVCSIFRDDFFYIYLTNFSYFLQDKKIQNLNDTVKTGKKNNFFKVGYKNIDGFSYFSLIFSYFVL